MTNAPSPHPLFRPGYSAGRPFMPTLPIAPRPAWAFHKGALVGGTVTLALLTAVIPGPWTIIGLLGVIAVATLMANPEWAFYSIVFAIPFESLKYISVSGLQLSVTEVFIFVCTAGWLGHTLLTRRIDVPLLGAWRVPLLVFGLVILASVSQSIDLKSSLKEILKWLEMLLVYLIAQRLVTDRRRTDLLLVSLLVAGIAESLVGFSQLLHIGNGLFHAAGVVRPAGTFDQPNPYAGFLNMSLPLAIALLLVDAPEHRRLARWSVVLVGVAVFAALSRGGWLAILAALGVMIWLAHPRWRGAVGWVAGLGGTVLLLSVVGALPFGWGEKIASDFAVANIDLANPTPANWSVAERLAHQLAGWNMFADHPILGVGIGNYGAQYSAYQVAPVWIYSLGHAHNYFINIAAEAGIPGLGAFLFLYGSGLLLALNLWREGETALQRAVGLGALGVLITVLTESLFDNMFVHSMLIQIALVMALVALAGRYLGPAEAADMAARSAPGSAARDDGRG